MTYLFSITLRQDILNFSNIAQMNEGSPISVYCARQRTYPDERNDKKFLVVLLEAKVIPSF